MADCEHKDQSGTFCGLCGKRLGLTDKQRDALARLADKQLADEEKEEAAKKAEEERIKAGGKPKVVGGGRSFV